MEAIIGLGLFILIYNVIYHTNFGRSLMEFIIEILDSF